jgi:hypothetical protein
MQRLRKPLAWNGHDGKDVTEEQLMALALVQEIGLEANRMIAIKFGAGVGGIDPSMVLSLKKH